MQAAGQYVTLVFVGFVSLNSLRAFLTVLRQVSTYVSSMFFTVATGAPAASGGGATAAAAAERTILGLGALLCAYTVSSVMLVRAQLPAEHRLIVTSALGFDDAVANTELDAVHRCAPLWTPDKYIPDRYRERTFEFVRIRFVHWKFDRHR